MKITPEFTRLHSGESNSRILNISIDKEYEGKKVKLGFITPMGKIYITDELKFTDNICRYPVPHMLLDGKGMLLTQLIVYENEDYLIKSPIEEYPVFSSVDDMSAPTVSDESLKSLAMIFDILLEKSDIGHIHDDLYYTESEVNALLSCKSDTEHKHEGVYLTKEELEGLLPEAEGTPFEHHHDSRYYTENEVNELLELKQDKLPLTDYVVEQGQQDIWTYRKWASGIAECWGKLDLDILSQNAYGSVFISPELLSFQEHPFPFAFTNVPNVTTGLETVPISATLMSGQTHSVTHIGTYYVVTYVNAGVFYVTFHLQVKGRWK